MRRAIIVILAVMAASAAWSQEPFTDFLRWKETFRYGTDKGPLSVRTEPGNEVYFVAAALGEGEDAVRVEADMDALWERVPGLVVPEYCQQAYVEKGGAVRHVYDWEGPRLALERRYEGEIPEDIDSYPVRKAGNGNGVFDPLMIMVRLRRGGDLADLVGATVVFAGKQYFVLSISRTLGYGGEGTVSKYSVALSEHNHIRLTVENEGYCRPLAFDVRLSGYRLKGRLEE